MSLTDRLLPEMWGEVARRLCFDDRRAFRCVSRGAAAIVRRYPVPLSEQMLALGQSLTVGAVVMTRRPYLAPFRGQRVVEWYRSAALTTDYLGYLKRCVAEDIEESRRQIDTDAWEITIRWSHPMRDGLNVWLEQTVDVKNLFVDSTELACVLCVGTRPVTPQIFVDDDFRALAAALAGRGEQTRLYTSDRSRGLFQVCNVLVHAVDVLTTRVTYELFFFGRTFVFSCARVQSVGALVRKVLEKCANLTILPDDERENLRALLAVYTREDVDLLYAVGQSFSPDIMALARAESVKVAGALRTQLDWFKARSQNIYNSS